MMWDWGSMWGWSGAMVLMGIAMLVFWGGIIALVIWLIVRLTRSGPTPSQRGNALDIARERYARGEITKEEFDQIKKDLS